MVAVYAARVHDDFDANDVRTPAGFNKSTNNSVL